MEKGLCYLRQLKYLDSILKNGRVPHAFLFHGPDQAVCRFVAGAIVYRLNDSNVGGWPIQGQTSSGGLTLDSLVSEPTGRTNPDVFWVQKLPDKKEIGIGQIRELRTYISRSAWGGRFKAAVIEDAHLLSEEGWDALLKTLEEPPPASVIFLLSAGVNVIPKTIISRALCLSFANPKVSPPPKGDIIIDKLMDGGLNIIERLAVAEKLAQSPDSIKTLDGWLIGLRQRLLAEPDRKPELTMAINAVVQAKKILVSTNANPRLVMENLLLRIGG